MQCIVEPVKHSHNRKSVLVLLGIPTDIQRWPCDWLLLSITSRNYVCSLAGQACENTPSKLWYLLYLFPEKAMAPHSSTLAWKIPWAEEPGRLQSMGSWRVEHDWATSLSLFTFMHWRSKWQPTPVFWPGESQGQGSLVGCRLNTMRLTPSANMKTTCWR